MLGSDANWNIFRYAADYLHFGGMLFGLATIVSTKSVEGFSWKTQVLYQMVYLFRYLDVFFDSQASYLVFFKITFNLVTATMLASFVVFRYTYDAASDSCNIIALAFPAFVVAMMASHGTGLKEELWTFSEFLEPVALLPQYIVCYRAQKVRVATLLYTLAVGGYRVLYVFNWMYKRYRWHSAYHDYVSWLGGGLECVLFADFVMRIVQRRDVIEASALGKAVLSLDENAGRVSENLEMRAIGRRLPLGLSGPGSALGADSALGGGTWNASDRIAEDEGCGLLTLDVDL